MMQNNDPSLSHISSALRTRNTVTTAPTSDIEISTFKEEHLETGAENEQGDKVCHHYSSSSKMHVATGIPSNNVLHIPGKGLTLQRPI